MASAAQLLARAVELHRAGDAAGAAHLYREVLALEPDNADALNLLGVTLSQRGRPAEALPLIARASELSPQRTDVRLNLATAAGAAGDRQTAVQALEPVLAREPDNLQALRLLGEARYRLGEYAAAAGLFGRVCELEQGDAQARFHLANALHELGRGGEAEAQYLEALELDPGMTEARLNLAAVCKERGDILRAVKEYERAANEAPHSPLALSCLLFARHYLPDADAKASASLARAWGERFAPPKMAQTGHANDPNPERRLRIGYVSADFRGHAVGTFLAPVLEAHGSGNVEVFCYSNNPADDAMTERMRAAAGHWRNIRGLSDEAAARLVTGDHIDVLVDLSGHTVDNRLGLFARKPAPVQAMWLGYFDTTGLFAMDFVVGDAKAPEQGAGMRYVEAVHRLEHSFLGYAPRDDTQKPAPRPALASGRVSFGCFNDTAKLNSRVLDLWARILRRAPASKLILKSRALRDASVRERFARQLADRGVAPERLELRAASGHAGYFAAYNDIDICLDPFPYNGGTVTCDALWMGVPVVCLAGDCFAGRMGASILSAAGLGEFLAGDEEEYVRICLELARPKKLAVAAERLRERMIDSPLCDVDGFARGLERAWQEMFAAWCRRQG